jgi:hypothetical protein
MKNLKSRYYLFSLTFFMVIFLIACNEYNEPTSIFEPGKSFPSNPTISGIFPADSAVAGINGREVTIFGTDFSTMDSTYIYFQGQRSLIKSISPTSVVVFRPTVYGDSIPITLEVPSALGPAHSYFKYKIERPIYPYLSAEVRLTKFTYKFTCMEVGAPIGEDEVLYIAVNKTVYQVIKKKVTQEELIYKYKDETAFFPLALSVITDMKFGPDGYLYFVTDPKNIVYRTLGGGGAVSTAPETFVNLTSNRASKLDFDQNGYLYCGYRYGIFVIYPNRTSKNSGRFNDNMRYTIRELHVYNGFVYSAVSYTGPNASISRMALWRNRIIPSFSGNLDSLDQNELVIDVTANTDAALRGSSLNSFCIDRNGTVYCCLQNTTNPLPYSVYVFENGTFIPFYTDNIIAPCVDQIAWGKNQDVYLNRGITIYQNETFPAAKDSVRLYRMGMGIQSATK